jgi:isoleucyl-tRNA synthetase
MSKSKGNVVAPQAVMKNLGADVLRLWVAATDYRGEMSVSDEILKRMADAYRRIRNTARYLLANLDGFDPAHHMVPTEQLLTLDRWAVDRAADLQRQIIAAYDSYEFHLIYQLVHQFCAVDMGSFYVDVLKDRMYTMRRESVGRRSAQTAMCHIAEALVRWIAPVCSYTADEIWGYLPGARSESVFIEQWYAGLPAQPSPTFTTAYWQRMLLVRDAVLKELERLRVAGGIGASLEAEVDIYCNREWQDDLARIGDELRFLFIVSGVCVHRDSEKSDVAVRGDSLVAGLEGVWIAVAPSSHAKCERCWHRREDVGSVTAHPSICGRCVENVDGSGERRAHV